MKNLKAARIAGSLALSAEAKVYPAAKLPGGEMLEEVIAGREIQLSCDPESRRPAVVRGDTGEAAPDVMAYCFPGRFSNSNPLIHQCQRILPNQISAVKAMAIP